MSGQTLMLSSKNTPQQNASLMPQTGCSKFFVSPELTPVAKAVQAQLPDVMLQAVHDFDHWLHSYTKHFPFDKTLDQAKWDPILVLHSSGSTGKHSASYATLTLSSGSFNRSPQADYNQQWLFCILPRLHGPATGPPIIRHACL